MPREKASILKLRKLGYSITQLEMVFGRSRSIIYKIVKFNEVLNIIPYFNGKNTANAVRLKTTQRIRMQMDYWIAMWMPFITGEADRPP